MPLHPKAFSILTPQKAAIRRIIIIDASPQVSKACYAVLCIPSRFPGGSSPCLSSPAGGRKIAIRSSEGRRSWSGTASMMSTEHAARWTSPARPCPCRRLRIAMNCGHIAQLISQPSLKPGDKRIKKKRRWQFLE